MSAGRSGGRPRAAPARTARGRGEPGGRPAIERADEIRAVYEGFAEERADAVETVSGWIRSVVFGGSWRFSDGEGLCQEILLELLLLVRRGGVRDPQAFLKLAQTVARRRAVDAWHRQRRRGETDEDPLPDDGPPDPAVSAERRVLARERLDALRYVIQRLPEHCRDLWRMVYVERMVAAAIGERLGLTAGNVRVRVHRCLEKARAIWAARDAAVGAPPRAG
ncbi:MAG: hypothetical protein Kow0062_28530 [Acidobacteriota bacterium]